MNNVSFYPKSGDARENQSVNTVKTLQILLAGVLLLFFSFTASVNAQSGTTPSDSMAKHRQVQVSFLPFIGTNGMDADNITNDYSFNIIGGYSKGVSSMELGYMFNFVKQDMRYCQIAGFINIVGGKSEGLQASGWLNLSKQMNGVQLTGMVNSAGEANGWQAAGLVNSALKGQPLQLAGLLNFAGNTSSVQMAGLANHAGRCEKAQLAGLVNNTFSSSKVQLAGLANNAIDSTSVQVAGLVNSSLGETNVQVAGLVNLAMAVNGAQVSGLVNIAKDVKGAQIGVLNVADSCTGVSIGVLSLVKNGYHKLEISADEVFPVNISFRTGVKHFHNSISAGIQPNDFEKPLWTYGYGIGSSFGNPDKWLMDIDLTSQHVMKQDVHYPLNDIFKLYVGLDRKVFSKASIAFGLTYNIYLTDNDYAQYSSSFSTLSPYHLTSHTYKNGVNMKSWLGAKIALRFF